MIAFETRLRSMLSGIITLRFHQLAYVISEWAWLIGLKPSSGKWLERISFLYIYLLAIGLMTPSVLGVIGGLYVAEAKTSPALQVVILQVTIPWIVAVISLLLVIMPWKGWLLRLTFGDIAYLSASPFDRRVIALWRYLEMVVVVPLMIWLPLVLIAPMFGSIWAQDVIPEI